MNKLVPLLFASLLLFGCIGDSPEASNQTASPSISAFGAVVGDEVSVNYVGWFEENSTKFVFDSNIEFEAQKAGLPPRLNYLPLNFTIGSGQVIKGFDEAVIGMQEGEMKTVEVQPEEAYGFYNESLVYEFNKTILQNNGSNIEPGQYLLSNSGARGKIIEVRNETFLIDYNHFLAGRTLYFELHLLDYAR